MVLHLQRNDKYLMARSVLMVEVSKVRERGSPRFAWTDGRCEGGLGQQRDDGGGCAAMKIGRGDEPWCICR